MMNYCFFIHPNALLPNQNTLPKESNCKNPLYRKREAVSAQMDVSSPASSSNSDKLPISSSHLPEPLFRNTCPHPQFLFSLFEPIERSNNPIGSLKQNQIKNKPFLIDEIKTYFKVKMMKSNINVSYSQVRDEWNQRFETAKSEEFQLPIGDKFYVDNIAHLRSIHYWAYLFSIRIFLLFYIQESYIFNLHLGPNEAMSDFHFQVSSQIMNSRTPKHYLLFSLIDFSETTQVTSNESVNKSKFAAPKGGMLFLNLKNRNPIPYFKLIESEKAFNRISVSFLDDNSGQFSFSNGTLSVSNYPNCPKLAILSALHMDSNNENENTPKPTNGTTSRRSKNETKSKILIAETSDIAYKVKELPPQESQNTNQTSYSIPFLEQSTFLSNDSIETDKYIKSYNERYMHMLEEFEKKNFRKPNMSDLVDHPLVRMKPFYQLIDAMFNGFCENGDSNKTQRRQVDKFVVVPIKNDVFYDFKKVEELGDNGLYESILKSIMEQFPQFFVPATYYRAFLDQSTKSPFNSLVDLLTKDCQIIPYGLSNSQSQIETLINQQFCSEIGLTPILSKAIQDAYFLSSAAAAIDYEAAKIYGGYNRLLLSNIGSIEDFIARTTIMSNIQITPTKEKNINQGSFPVVLKTFQNNLKSNNNKPIPEPPFTFIKKDSNSLIFDIDIDKNLEKMSRAPCYCYQFFSSFNPNTSLIEFSILSRYNLVFIYRTRETIYVIGDAGEDCLSYGSCKTLNTEINFYRNFKGKFVSAVYMEYYYSLIVCIEENNQNKLIFFDHSDQQYWILRSKNELKLKYQVVKMAVLSQSYFGLVDTNNEYHVFHFIDGKIVELEKKHNMHLYNNKFAYEFLQKTFDLRNNKSSIIFCTYSDYGPCIASLTNGSIEQLSQSDVGDHISIHFNTPNHYLKANLLSIELNEYELQNKLLKRESELIPPMLNYLPIQKIEEKTSFSCFDLNCSICELFPSLIVTNHKIVTFDDESKSFALFDFDPQVIRPLSQQIQGYCLNSMMQLNFFAAEVMFNSYLFPQYYFVVIMDLCGIGARLSNLLYGTRFDSHEILQGDIWTGFSYSEKVASLIVLFRINQEDVSFIERAFSNSIAQHKLPFTGFQCVKESGHLSITYKQQSREETFSLADENELDTSLYSLIHSNKTPQSSNSQSEQNEQRPKKTSKSSTKKSRSHKSDQSSAPKTPKKVASKKPCAPELIDNQMIIKVSKNFIAKYLTWKKFSHLPQETVTAYASNL